MLIQNCKVNIFEQELFRPPNTIVSSQSLGIESKIDSIHYNN
jgi:hypothetical protein